jgi:PAS domain S-box-containing protein
MRTGELKSHILIQRYLEHKKNESFGHLIGSNMTVKPSYEELERRVQGLETTNTLLEKKLHEARFFSEEIMTYMTEGLVLTDTRGIVIFINQRLSKMLGYLSEEIIGKCWLDLVPPDQHAIAKEAEARRAQGHTDRYEIILHRKDGHKFLVLIGAGPRFDKLSGDFIGTMGVVTDITKSKRLEEDWRESEFQKELILNATSELVAYYDPDLRIKWVNTAAASSVGRRPEEMIGSHCYFFWNHINEPCSDCPVIKARDEKVPQVTEKRTPDGRHWNIRGFPILEEDKVIGLAEFSLDITERKLAEESVARSAEEHRILLENIQTQIWYLTDDHTYGAVNKAHADFMGVQIEDLAFKNMYDSFPEDVVEVCRQGNIEVFTTGKPVRSEEWLPHVSGERRLISILKSPKLHADGTVEYVVCSAEDITERKQAEEALRESEERAKMQRNLIAQLTFEDSIINSSIDDALKTVTSKLAATLQVDRVSVWLLSEDETKLQRLALYDAGTGFHSQIDDLNAVDIPSYFEALRKDSQVDANDAQNDPRTKELTDDYFIPLQISSLLDSAIQQNGRLIGVLSAEHRGPVRKWHPDEKSFLSAITNLIAQLFANAEFKQVEEKLKHSERTYHEIFNSITDALFIHDIDTGSILDVNDSMLYKFGYKREELPGLTVENLSTLLEPYTNKKAGELIKRAGRGETVVFEWLNRKKNGELFYSENILKFVEIAGAERIIAIVRDITERKQAEEEKEKLQTQLLQAQKMESVGRLAGGVAHDFNNMLGVILGHTELALLRTDDKHKLCSDLNEIQKAAKRSADITKQLLAFARKQTISPRQLDLNDTVESMLNMLRRLIGEEIDLVWQPSPHLWPVKIDPSQIDQILANLCVNAKDAIDGVGKLTIETGIKTFDEEYCNEHLGFIPGDFVLLAVSDNGCGMDKDTLSNLFEPFFTTKEVGKGTGLGLATIYGIIKQNNGFINVYSEPGQGSTFKIYLPRLVGDENIDKAVPEKKTAAGGSETILLVEDEPAILRMTRMMLERNGYFVLSAATPTKAIDMANAHADKIHLLMTDVVMPEMNGRDLAEKMSTLYPEIKVLFMSGYTADVIAHQGVLDDSEAFIQKPFSMVDMTEKVREVLDMASDKS